MDQLEAMRVFAAVADRGSLSAAARALGVPVASVSRKLAALEAHTDARLLARTTRRMALTEAGRRYLDAVRRVLAAVEEADRRVAADARELRGPLAVTAPLVFGRLHVLPIVTEFLRAHPRVDLQLLLADRNVEMIEAGIDVAVRIGALPDSSIVAQRVGSVRRITCASPAYLRERGTPAAPEDLAAHDGIAFAMLTSGDGWPYPARRGTRTVAVRARLTVTTAEAAIDAAVAGLGVTRVLSYQAAAELAAGRLVAILERFEPPALPVHVLHAEGGAPRPKLRAFTTLAAARLRAALRA
ncbi:MAG: LysR family transcriptional regulator [Proteobacteria bacterium]|nr:MAG: LysR family transcriptional regulator [Pseudomonadota bacterium]